MNSFYRCYGKRIFDLTLAVVLLMVLSPVLVVIALVLYLKLGCPVLFRQQRPGLHGNPFVICKFRSMTDVKDKEGLMLQDSERLSNIGKWLRSVSIDELPELWNVIKGDMSFVGPRPLLVEYLPLYSPEQSRRHEVRPGITGWAQINGRNAISWEEKFKLDIWYVDQRSLWLDIKILYMTFWHLLKQEGVHAENNVTMPKFTGSHT